MPPPARARASPPSGIEKPTHASRIPTAFRPAGLYRLRLPSSYHARPSRGDSGREWRRSPHRGGPLALSSSCVQDGRRLRQPCRRCDPAPPACCVSAAVSGCELVRPAGRLSATRLQRRSVRSPATSPAWAVGDGTQIGLDDRLTLGAAPTGERSGRMPGTVEYHSNPTPLVLRRRRHELRPGIFPLSWAARAHQRERARAPSMPPSTNHPSLGDPTRRGISSMRGGAEILSRGRDRRVVRIHPNVR